MLKNQCSFKNTKTLLESQKSLDYRREHEIRLIGSTANKKMR